MVIESSNMLKTNLPSLHVKLMYLNYLRVLIIMAIFQVLSIIAAVYTVYITVSECIKLWKEINK